MTAPSRICGTPVPLDRIVADVLGFAGRVLQASNPGNPLENLSDKILSETAMLLHCAASVQHCGAALPEPIAHLTSLLAARARNHSVLVAVCTNPGLAHNKVTAHAVVSRLGYPDPSIDRLLAESRALDSRFGPEKLPLDLLEQEWLAGVWPDCRASRPERGLLARSILGRDLNVLTAARFDVYSFTHALIYATDFGARRPALRRPVSAIAADADAALSLSLDIDDLDVTAELVMTWPMLALPWSATASFAFSILNAEYHRLGFLPGPGFDADRCAADAFATSYHTTYVMGMLCATAMRGDTRTRSAHLVGSKGAASALLPLLQPHPDGQPRWRTAFLSLSPDAQDALAPMILTMALRHAADDGDLSALRNCLQVALERGLIHTPSVRQAIALLKHGTALDRILRNCSEPNPEDDF